MGQRIETELAGAFKRVLVDDCAGRVAAAASGNIVIGYVDLPTGTASRVVAAGEQIDVIVANRYTKV